LLESRGFVRINWTLVGGLVVLGAAGAAGTAVAASITTTPGNAARGVSVSTGYTTSNLTYTTAVNSPSSLPAVVTGVTFTLSRVSGTVPITSANTVVYVQLMATTYGNWASCTVGTSNSVSCTLTGSQRKTVAEVTGTNVVAYDALGT
jgi:hypothetical protein